MDSLTRLLDRGRRSTTNLRAAVNRPAGAPPSPGQVRDALDQLMTAADLATTTVQARGAARAARADLAARQLRDRVAETITPEEQTTAAQDRRHPIIGGSRPVWLRPRATWMP